MRKNYINLFGKVDIETEIKFEFLKNKTVAK